MNPPTSLMLMLLVLLCSSALVLPWRLRWRRGSAARQAQLPRHAEDMPVCLETLRSEMNRLIASGQDAQADARPYESLEEALLRGHHRQRRGHARPIVVTQAAQTHQGIDCSQPLFAADDLQLRESSDLALVMAKGHLVLGPHSRVRGWAHADKTLLLGEDSVSSQQLSSGRGIALAAGCRFHRLHAPVIVMGRPFARHRGERTQPRKVLPEHPPLANATHWGADGWRVEGDCTLLPGHRFSGSLVVSGVLRIGAGAVVEGDIKARRGVVVGERACVRGAVLCAQDIRIGEEAQVSGPVMSAAMLQIGANVRLGTLPLPTSVSAQLIRADEGVIVHGTVWAIRSGRVGAVD